MLTALVLICSLSAIPDLRDCTRHNAAVVMSLPGEFNSPVTCFMHGQAYLAQTWIGRELAENERVKVVCVRKETTDDPIRSARSPQPGRPLEYPSR
jgi:hypothetical protein